MSDDDDEGDTPLTEPIIASDAYASGIDVEVINGDLRLIAWVDHQGERRIVARWVFPNNVGRRLIRDLRKSLSLGSN